MSLEGLEEGWKDDYKMFDELGWLRGGLDELGD